MACNFKLIDVLDIDDVLATQFDGSLLERFPDLFVQ